MNPSVGRIVHYVSYGTPGGEYGQECRAAVITEVNRYAPGAVGDRAGEVGLAVLNPGGMFFNQAVPCDEGVTRAFDPAESNLPLPPALCDGLEHAGGTWHWPARV